MSLKKFNPTTPSLRHTVITSRQDLWKGAPLKTLVTGIKSSGGRNNQGRITCRHKGGGVKTAYRNIDFLRNKNDVSAEVLRLEYDPNRTAFIALIKYSDGELSYIIAPQHVKVGDKIISSDSGYITPGNCFPLSAIPNGTIIHCIELNPGRGAKLARSAGTYAQLLSKASNYAILKLKSGELRKVSLLCKATIGTVSNSDHQNTVIGKAGRSRWLGIRPTVRGVVMNPVDHPHGGGEGRTSGGRHPCSPWGWKTKGKKTRSTKKSNKFIVRDRRKK